MWFGKTNVTIERILAFTSFLRCDTTQRLHLLSISIIQEDVVPKGLN